MKKLLTLFLLSTLSIPSMAQTIDEIEAEISRRKQEIQNLTLQNNNYDLKLQEKEKEEEEAKKKLATLQTKRNQSKDACKSISESDLKLMEGLSAGTIAISGIGTTAGIINNTGMIDKIADKNKSETSDETNENQQSESTLQKATTSNKIMNIGTTVTSAGSTITSAIALSKVNGLKDDIKKCVDSFN